MRLSHWLTHRDQHVIVLWKKFFNAETVWCEFSFITTVKLRENFSLDVKKTMIQFLFCIVSCAVCHQVQRRQCNSDVVGPSANRQSWMKRHNDKLKLKKKYTQLKSSAKIADDKSQEINKEKQQKHNFTHTQILTPQDHSVHHTHLLSPAAVTLPL